MVDVIGVVTEVGAIKSINTKLGAKDQRVFSLADDGNLSMKVTLWGAMSESKIVEGQVIAIRSAKISEFNGKTLNCGDDHATIF